jgi:hypothetical protein
MLVGLRRPLPARDCGGEAFLFTRTHPERITPVTNEAILNACAGPGWQEYRRTETWRVLSCAKLKRGKVDGQPVARVLDEDRLVPGERFSVRKALQ